MNASNPYASPVTINDAKSSASEEPDSFRSRTKKIAFAWIRLLAIYNLVLTAETVVLTLIVNPVLFTMFGYWLIVIICAIFANVFFGYGPAAEILTAILFKKTKPLRIVLFLAGMLFAMLLTAVVVLNDSTGIFDVQIGGTYFKVSPGG